MGIRRLVTPSLAAMAITALGYLAYRGLTHDLQPGQESDAIRYRPVPIERGGLRETVVATGTMEPLARVAVKSDVPGVVHAIHVEEGDRVERNDPLVALDQERLEDRVAELRAALENQRALASVDLVRIAEVERAQARRELARTTHLVDKGVLSRVELELANDRLSLAEVALENARAETQARRAAVAQATETLHRAQKDLRKSVILSPIDGIVITRNVVVGTAVADLAAGGTVVAVIADDRRIRLVAEVDENDIGRVRKGQPVEVRVDAFPDETTPGTVAKVSSSGTVERNVSNFEVEIEVEEQERFRVGMSADARIVVSEHPDSLVVPNSAIVRRDGAAMVRLHSGSGDDGHELVPVATLFSDGFRTAIRDGNRLKEGLFVLVRAEGEGR